MTDASEDLPAPGVRSTRVLSRALVVALLMLLLLIAFGISRYQVISDRLDGASERINEQSKAIGRLSSTVQDQADALTSLDQLAAQFARLTSSDPAERAAAREELARLAAEARARRERSGSVTTPSTSSSRPEAPPSTTSTTRLPPSTTTTTRGCLSAVAVEVCRR